MSNDIGTQENIMAQLWQMVENQQNMIDSQDSTIASQRDMIQGQRATIGVLKTIESERREQLKRQESNHVRAEEQAKYYMDVLREVSTIRDIQEDKLDAMTEEIEKLSAEFEVVNDLLQTATQQLDTKKQSTSDPTDEQLYRKLLEIGKNDMAATMLASARHVNQLAAVCHAWMYQTDEAGEKSLVDNGKELS